MAALVFGGVNNAIISVDSKGEFQQIVVVETVAGYILVALQLAEVLVYLLLPVGEHDEFIVGHRGEDMTFTVSSLSGQPGCLFSGGSYREG